MMSFLNAAVLGGKRATCSGIGDEHERLFDRSPVSWYNTFPACHLAIATLQTSASVGLDHSTLTKRERCCILL